MAAALGDYATPTLVAAQETSTTSEDSVKQVRTFCRSCGKMECPIWATVKNGRVIRIEGDAENPASMGNCCSKSRAGIQALHHPDRVKYPMKRTNPKGEDPGWVRISWDEALTTAAQKLQQIIDESGPRAIRMYHGTSRQTTYSVYGLMNLLRSPNTGCTAGQVCKGPRQFSSGLTCYPGAHWHALVDGVKVYVQWGSNTEVSNYDDAGRTTIARRWEAEKHIVVGPRLQNLGKEADIWLPLRPGTDDAMAAGWLNVIINEGLYDKHHVQRWTNAPFLYADELEPSGFVWAEVQALGVYPLNISTRLVKESDLVEGGSPRKFAVMDQLSGKITFFDAETGYWEGETPWAVPGARAHIDGPNVPKPGYRIIGGQEYKGGYLPDEVPFDPAIDPALFGEFGVTLKSGQTVKAKPVFQKLADSVAEWTPEKTAEVTWVDASKIQEAARTYASAPGNGGIAYMLASEHAGKSVQTTRTILLISAITNNIDTPGGNRGGEMQGHLYEPRLPYAASFGSRPLSVEEKQDMLGAERFPLLPWTTSLFSASLVYDQTTGTDAILTGKPYQVRAQVSMSGQFFHSANATKNWEALNKLEFHLCSELWFSPTAETADIILPSTHFLETQTTRMSQGASGILGPQVRVVEPLWESKPDTVHSISLAQKMNLPWWPMVKEAAPPWFPQEYIGIPWPTEQQMQDYECSPMKAQGVKNWDDFVEQYQTHGVWDLKSFTSWGNYRRYITGDLIWGHAPGFPMPTKKIELLSTVLESYHPGEELPVVREPYESPISTPDVYEEYPIVLTSGRRSPVFFHSEHRQLPWTREQWPVPRCEMHPDTAEELGLKAGDWVWIESKRGRVRMMLDVYMGIDPRAIEVCHGWWYPELPAPNHGWELSNINVLVDEYSQDPIYGSTTLRGYLVKVYKAEEGAPEGIIQSADDPRLKKWLPTYEGEARS